MLSATTYLLFTTLLPFIVQLPLTNAASAEQWRSRSIYQVCDRPREYFFYSLIHYNQVVTDRFATSDSSSPPCDASQRKYCSGTWTVSAAAFIAHNSGNAWPPGNRQQARLHTGDGIRCCMDIPHCAEHCKRDRLRRGLSRVRAESLLPTLVYHNLLFTGIGARTSPKSTLTSATKIVYVILSWSAHAEVSHTNNSSMRCPRRCTTEGCISSSMSS
jgi:hypothetical protein